MAKRFLKYQYILLALIIILGFVLRIYQLDKVPAGFFCDEAATGYNAYKILTTGADEYEKPFPLLFYSFGNSRLPIPIYFTVPFIALFGLNEFSTRFASAVIGTLSIPLMYLLINKLFPKKHFIGTIGAFLLAIAPWHVHHSRTGMENIYLPFFILLGIYLFVLGVSRRPLMLILSALSFGLGFYTYYPSYLLIPLTVILLTAIYFKELIKIKKYAAFAVAVFFVISTPIAIFILNGRALARLNSGTLVFSALKSPQEVFVKTVQSYALHFGPEFLFTSGDAGHSGQFILRHSVLGMGMLYWFELPFILLAILYLFINIKKNKNSLIIFMLLVIYPLGSTLGNTVNPLATRSILGSVTFPMLTALGITISFKFVKRLKYLYSAALITVIVACFVYYLNLYFIEYPKNSAGFWGWQYGPHKIVAYFVTKEAEYDDLYMVPEFNAPHIFFKFYAPNNCTKCKLGAPHDSYNSSRKQLFAVSPHYLSQHPEITFKTQYTVYYPNGTVAFQIGRVVSL